MQRVDFVRLLYEVKRTGCTHFHWTVMYCYFTDWLMLLPFICGTAYVCVVGGKVRGMQRNMQKEKERERRLRIPLRTGKSGVFEKGFCTVLCHVRKKVYQLELILQAEF